MPQNIQPIVGQTLDSTFNMITNSVRESVFSAGWGEPKLLAWVLICPFFACVKHPIVNSYSSPPNLKAPSNTQHEILWLRRTLISLSLTRLWVYKTSSTVSLMFAGEGERWDQTPDGQISRQLRFLAL